ncbi:MAG: hypothetical protein OK454_09185 [Thaumarchaeota archaeon]|nr:hypothetical protein [Nitrososphaerota archaeon]
MSKVFFIDGSALWVSGIKVRSGIIRGFVENGRWNVSISPGTKTVGVVGDSDRRKYETLEAVEVPADILAKLAKEQRADAIPGGVIYIDMWSNFYAHYNDVIAWARKQKLTPL